MTETIHIPGFYEPVASWLHLAAAAVVLVGAWRLARSGVDRAERVLLAIYGVGAFGMFALSGTYHLLDVGGEPRMVLQRLDHAFIWVMIAGSFSAIHVVAFKGRWRWGFLAVVWLAAITGLVLKTVYFTTMNEGLGLALYLSLGWMGIASGIKLYRSFGWADTRGLALGGFFYSAGAVYEFARGPAIIEGVVGPHEIFHLAVIAGAWAHWRYVRHLMMPTSPRVPLGAKRPLRMSSVA